MNGSRHTGATEAGASLHDPSEAQRSRADERKSELGPEPRRSRLSPAGAELCTAPRTARKQLRKKSLAIVGKHMIRCVQMLLLAQLTRTKLDQRNQTIFVPPNEPSQRVLRPGITTMAIEVPSGAKAGKGNERQRSLSLVK